MLPKVVVRVESNFVFEEFGTLPGRWQAVGAHCISQSRRLG